MKKLLIFILILLVLGSVYVGLSRMGYVPAVCPVSQKLEGRYTVERKSKVNGKFFIITREFDSKKGYIFQVSEEQFAGITEGLIYDANNMKGWKIADREE